MTDEPVSAQHLALQHVLVRMLHDPAFVDAVFANPDHALSGTGLTRREAGWILETDRRAFRTDPHRRARALAGLLEEFPASCACLVRTARRDPPAAVLDDFFSSATFHTGMQGGRSLALCFGEFVTARAEALAAAKRASLAPELARLECAVARLRRTQLTRKPASAVEIVEEGTRSWLAGTQRADGRRLRTSPLIAWVRVLPGTLERLGEIRTTLAMQRTDLRAAVVDPNVDVGPLQNPLPTSPADHEPDEDETEKDATGGDAQPGNAPEPVLLTAQVGPAAAIGAWLRIVDVELAPVAEELATVLDAALAGATIPALLGVVHDLGVDEPQCAEVLGDLCRDGLLVAG